MRPAVQPVANFLDGLHVAVFDGFLNQFAANGSQRLSLFYVASLVSCLEFWLNKFLGVVIRFLVRHGRGCSN